MKKAGILLTFAFFFLLSETVHAQSTGDFQSHASGNWNSTSTWERWNGTSWITPAPNTPTDADGIITVLNGHTVTVTANVQVDQVVIAAGGQVTISSGVTITFAKNSGNDMTVSGTYLNQGTSVKETGGSHDFTINSGGTFIHNSSSAISALLDSFTLNAASTFIYRGSSTLTPSISVSNRTYGNLSFESTSGSWTASVNGSNALIINGDFSIGSGVTYSTTQTGTMTFAGNFTNNGTLTNSTGTQVYTLTGSGKTISGSGTIQFETWNVNAGASITLARDVDIASTFTGTISGTLNCGTSNVTGAGTFTLSSGATLGIGSAAGITSSGATGNIQTTTRSFSTGANYTYNGSVAQATGNGLPATVNNLTISNTNASGVTLGGNITIAGTLTINSSSILVAGTNTISGTGTPSAVINGTLKTANTNGFSGSTGQTLSNTITTITLGSSSTIEYNATGAQSITARTDYANLTISGSRGGGTITLPTGTVGLSGALSITATNALYARTGNTIEFSGSGSQTIPAFDYNDLKSSNSGARTLINGGTIGILGTFTPGSNTYTITNNTIDFKASTAQTVAAFNYNNLTISGARTTNNVTLANGNIGVAGNFNLSASFSSGSLIPGSSTLLFNGSSSQQYTNSSGSSFNNVTVSNSAGLLLISDMTLGTSGVLNLSNGTVDARTNSKTVAVTNTATTAVTRTSGYIDGKLQWSLPIIGAMTSYVFPVGTINGYSPVQVDITLTAGATTFTASATQSAMPGVATPSATLQRYWTLTTPGTVTSKLKFTYLAGDVSGGEAAYRIFKNTNGSTPFVFPDGNSDNVDETTHTATTINNVTSYSDWSAGEPNAPTDVALMNFNAASDEQGNVLLEWQTGYEVSNLGFNVYRDRAGQREKINPTILAGSVALSGRTIITAGLNYVWMDKLASAKDYAQYWLEDVDLSGKTMWHGPISAVPVAKLPDRAQSLLLSQLHTNAASNDTQRFLRPMIATAAKATPAKPSLRNLQTQWDIAAKPGAKIIISKAGWTRVSQPELVAAGFDVSRDPRFLQLFCDGSELPILVNGGLKGRLEPSDSIEFYGQALDTPSSNQRSYFLLNGAQAGRRLSVLPFNKADLTRRLNFSSTVERRDRFLYFPSLNNGEADNWFGAVIYSTPFAQTLDLAQVDQQASTDALLEVALQGLGSSSHSVSVQVNGQPVGALQFDGQLHQVAQFSISHQLLQEGANTVTLTASGGSADFSVIDWLKLSYAHRFDAADDRLLFSGVSGEAVQVSGFTTPEVRVFDITDETSPVELKGVVELQEKLYRVTVVPQASGERVLLAVTDSGLERAAQVKPQVGSSWHLASQGADVVMVVHGSLRGALEPLLQMRKQQGYAVAVVDVEDVYDEFSYGQKTAQAIQDFLAAATKWKRAPRYVLLVGDASYDGKNYLGLGEWDLVPTKVVWTNTFETASDDWLADVNGDGVPEMAVGRLPVRTPEEATRVIAKITGYRNNQTDGALLVADRNEGFDFETASNTVKGLLPAGMAVRQIFRAQMDDATASQAIINAVNRGPKLVNYAGHGSSSIWRGNLLTTDSVSQMTNQQALPMVISMTCLNGLFNDPHASSLGETLLLSAQGGAIAVWASSAQTTAGGQAVMNQEFIRQLFQGVGPKGQSLTLGEAAMRAKAAVGDLDIRKSWILLGDPMMVIR